jgi:Icc-related predicted phosphoesterase
MKVVRFFDGERFRTMRVLAVTDKVVESIYSPAIRDLARGVKFVIACGDLPSHYLEFIVSMLDVPVFYVMGNHGGMGGEKEIPEGCINMDGRVLEWQGVLLAGLEGSIRYNERPEYQYTEGEMRTKVGLLTPQLLLNKWRYGRYLDICITHAPPYGIQDGTDLPHRGFKSYLWLIEHFRPSYLFHGHQHVYDPRTVTQTLRHRTLVINAFGYRIMDLNLPGAGRTN